MKVTGHYTTMLSSGGLMKMEAYSADQYLVIVPSIRPVNLEYLSTLRDLDIFIADDSDGKVDRSDILNHRYKRDGFKNIVLGSRSFGYKYIPSNCRDLFAKYCPSIKSLGLYYAWEEGYKAIILIDDDVDTRATGLDGFLRIGKLEKKIDGFYSPSGWFNTLSLINNSNAIYARGYPYEYRGESHRIVKNTADAVPAFNQGLWMGTPDINGIDKINMDREYLKRAISGELDDGETPWHIDITEVKNQIKIGVGQRLPLSIMNVQMAVSLIPAFYQPSDYIVDRFKIRRHDDIWSMYFLKKIMDMNNLDTTVGEPLLWHRKAGDPIGETLSEHCTNIIQGIFTDIVDMAAGDVYLTGNMDICTQSIVLANKCWQLTSRMAKGLWKTVLEDYFTKCSRWARMFT